MLVPKEKKLIPNELLPPKYQNKGYRMSPNGDVYGVFGKKLKPNDWSPNGFNHPLLFNRNLWYIRATMFVPNPENHKRVVLIGDDVHWLSEKKYREMVNHYLGREAVERVPLKDRGEVLDEMLEKGAKIADIARALGYSRAAIYKYLEKNNYEYKNQKLKRK
ncbi:HNH endonuclease [Vibrio phage Phriendly]|nr:HNH endonuclease [Vibrio phage Phriendly]